MLIDNESEAIAVLQRISYFRLACYWRPMEYDKIIHMFKPESHLDDVLKLYKFDSELKSLLFNFIQHIEIAVRTQIIQKFSIKYGPFWFMDKRLFSNEEIFKKHLNSLQKAIERTNDDFILDYFKRYDNPNMPPAWKTLELATLGTLSRMYSNFSDNVVKKQIARNFSIPQHEFMRNWLYTIDLHNIFITKLKALIENYPSVDIAAMGFPQNWQQEPLWQ